MKHLRSRVIAGALAFVVAVSSLQLPSGNVRAEEAVEKVKETETTVTEETGHDEGTVSESVPVTKEAISDETETVSDIVVETTVKTDTDGLKTEEVGFIATELESEIQEETSRAEETEETVQTEELTQESSEEVETEQALKASGNIASGSYENITWCIDANGKLTVEGTGEFSDSTGTERAPWCKYDIESFVRFEIKSAEIKVTGIKNISHMFYDCGSLTEVDLSGLDTSSVTDMSYMFGNCGNLTEVDLSGLDTSSVTDMSYMFRNCDNLTKVDLSGLDTSSVTNMSSMFENCGKLTEVDLSGLDISSVTNMSSMFENCGNLTKVDLSGLDISSVTNMSSMFENCGKLTEVDLSGFDSSSVTNMSEMFGGCSNLTEINLSGLDTSSVTDMSGMFRRCSNLTEINLSGLDTSSVTDMSGMFGGCSNLTEINLSGLDTSSVTDMSGMFSGCSSLTEINLSGLDTRSVTDMSYMFFNCDNLTEVDLSGLDTSSVTNMLYMFNNCDNLTEINLSGLDAGNVSNISDIFGNCACLNVIYTLCNLKQSVELPVSYGDIWRDSDGQTITMLPIGLCDSIKVIREEKRNGSYGDITWSIDDNRKLIVEGTGEFPRVGTDRMAPWYGHYIRSAEIKVKGMKNASCMFYCCHRLTEVDLSGFDSSSVTNMSSMFYGCSSLTEIDLSSSDTRNVTNMSEMFSGCSNLTEVNLSGLNTENVTNMSSMFYDCSSLTEVDLSSIDTSSVTNMKSMFSECSNLTEINLSGLNTENVTNMSSMFYNCSSLTEIDMSNLNANKVSNMSGIFTNCSNLKKINMSGTSINNVKKISFAGLRNLIDLNLCDMSSLSLEDMSSLFEYCESLTKIDLSGLDTSSVTNMKSMFSECSNLTEINLSGLNTENVTNMSYVFCGCSSLTEIDLSGLDTSNVTDMSYMFGSCSSLTKIDLSGLDTGNVRRMIGMFCGCSSLTEIDLSGFDTKEVTDIHKMFSGCSNLINLDLSGFDGTQGVEIYDIFADCQKLKAIYTPYNFDKDFILELPDMSAWYQPNGTYVSNLKNGSSDSILITKYGKPSIENVSLKAVKKKTVYKSGDILHTDDLTVKCYDTDGLVRKVMDYTTNADQIDMFTSGIKTLIITYRGYTAEIPITVKGKETPVKISGITVTDSMYTGKPFTYTGTVAVMTSAGTDVTADISLTYTYTGTTADGKIYEASILAPVNAGNYKLTVAVPKENSNYTGRAEYTFKITKAPVEITASDITRFMDETVPTTYRYQTNGLLNGDTLITEPSFTCNADITKAGTYEIIPHDADAGMNYEISYINGTLTVKEGSSDRESVEISGLEISDSIYTGKAVSYSGNASVKSQDGADITDDVTLTYSYSGTQADGSSYTPSESAPVNAGEYMLTVAVPQDNEHYEGSVEYRFAVTKAPLTVTALDKVYEIGKDTELPAAYPYEVTGLVEGDKLTMEPSFTYTDTDGNEINKDSISLKESGSYHVIPKEADAGMNYTVNYQKGTLTIKAATGDLPNDDNEVLPDDIPQTGIPTTGVIWTSAVEDQSYTGAAVKPAVRVYFDKKRLTEKTDYMIAYKNNKNLGTADIIITGKGNYKDKKTVHFNIIQKDISDKDVIIEDMAYADDGKQHKEAPNVIYNGKKLKMGKDFTIEYGEGDYTTAGDYYATISGIGNYKGTYDKVKTTIVDKNMLLNKAKVTKIPNQEYNKGQEIVLPDSAIIVTLNGTVLKKDTDYTVGYVNNCDVGKASVVIRGKGKYAGTKTAYFKIVRTPVNIGEAELVCDYNKETLFAKGGSMPDPKVSCNGETLRKGTDYTLSYKNNKKCGTASFTVKGKGSYKGNRTFDFTVKEKDLSAIDIRVPDIVYSDKANKYQSKPILTDTDGNILKAGTDYIVAGYTYDGNTLDKQDCPPEGAEITVTVQGKGSYTGTRTASYKLKKGTDISRAKITVADQSYTGTCVKPDQNAVTGASIKVNKTMENLVYGRDYEIAAYGINVKKGTGTVVVRGLGNYCGEKTVKFKITGKSVE